MRVSARLWTSGRLRASGAGLGEFVSSAWLVPASVIGRLAGLVAIALVSRTLSPVQFGELALMQSAGILVAGLCGLGLPLAVTRQVAYSGTRDAAAAGRYLGATLVLTLVAAGCAVGLLWWQQDFVASTLLGDARLSSFVLPASVGVAAMTLAAAGQAGLTGLESFREVAALQTLQALAGSAGLVIGATTGGIRGALLFFAAAMAVAASLSVAAALRRSALRGCPVAPVATRSEYRALGRIAGPAAIAAIVVALALFGDRSSYVPRRTATVM